MNKILGRLGALNIVLVGVKQNAPVTDILF